MTFYQSRYVSKYLTFTPVETQTVSHAALQALSAQQQQIFSKYDAPPYVAASAQQTIPFTDFGNRFLTNGASYDASLLHGKTWQQVAAALRDPASPIGQGALGTANYLTRPSAGLPLTNQPAYGASRHQSLASTTATSAIRISRSKPKPNASHGSNDSMPPPGPASTGPTILSTAILSACWKPTPALVLVRRSCPIAGPYRRTGWGTPPAIANGIVVRPQTWTIRGSPGSGP